jgi:predicted alpha/beta hydrolase family esterase
MEIPLTSDEPQRRLQEQSDRTQETLSSTFAATDTLGSLNQESGHDRYASTATDEEEYLVELRCFNESVYQFFKLYKGFHTV